AAMVIVFGFFVIRLFTLQILDGKLYLAQADENRTTSIKVQTQRGIIYDRNGYVLARNVASYNVIITPAYLPLDEGAMQQIYRELSELINIPVNRGDINDEEAVRLFKPCDNDFGITQIVHIGDTNAPFDPIQIACDVDKETAMIVREKSADYPGVGIEIEPMREYPDGWVTSEIVGFLGPIPAAVAETYRELGFVPGRDKYGYAGVEDYFEEVLRGRNGERVVEVDVAGKELRNLTPPVEPVAGDNLVLTIDTRLQLAAKNAVMKSIRDWNTWLGEQRMSNAVVIAMNPKTGEVLAMVSYPTYENNRMARFIPAYYFEQLSRDPHKPLINHAISAEHPPGSVYKMATALGILNEGVVTPQTTIFDPGRITILNRYFPNEPGRAQDYVCWTYRTTGAGHGVVDFLKGLSQSCNIYFNKVAGGFPGEIPVGLNVWRLKEYAKALGYGSLTGIELPGEADGLVPDPTWKRINVGENWATGDTYLAGMGEGYVLATALQVLMSNAIIANDGKYIRPTILKEIQDAEGTTKYKQEPDLKWDITKDAIIGVYDEDFYLTEERKTVEPWVLDYAKKGMEMAVTEGTAKDQFIGFPIPSAGKTGTAEFCDNIANEKGLCKPGNWPAHAWYMAYAPLDDPEIAVVAFMYY
ncbi:MAG: penicillin-binding protein 2, partial [Anaerolineaceae bacterium]|nr:penicillin-binding protein 2 [Anaerolineaceae bacterium]